MADNRKKAAFRMLFLIATPKLVNKATGLFKEGNVPMQYVFHAQGTATSEVMDMLGLDGVDKNILMSMMPKLFADEMLKKLRKKLHLGMPNTGIAFTVLMSGGSGHLVQLIESLEPEEDRKFLERNDADMTENEYSMIMAIVNQGYSEDVMNAARPKGASGGTVFHSRRIGSQEAMKFWKISVQEEREVVIILATKEDKLAIMKEIGQKCGMQSKAQGVVMSLPVDGIVGLD
ncbi:MAG TPA: transposase [Lachnospiraceae bacterium]|nr:transposase [Lachnospiraceae bacterium]